MKTITFLFLSITFLACNKTSTHKSEKNSSDTNNRVLYFKKNRIVKYFGKGNVHINYVNLLICVWRRYWFFVNFGERLTLTGNQVQGLLFHTFVS